MLWMYKRVIFGKLKNINLLSLKDLNRSEQITLISLAVFIIFFGFYPEPLIATYQESVKSLVELHNINLNISANLTNE